MSFSLGEIRLSNSVWNPQKILIYGPEGIGKTCFGATFEAPILARVEDGACALPVPTFPSMVKSYEDMAAAINALHEPGHPYKSLVVDTMDWLEPLVWEKLVKENPYTEKGKEVKTIEDYGYGKGYLKCDQWWRDLLGGFDSLRDRASMNIILIAHSEIKTHTPPETDPYDRYQIKLQKRANEMVQEWADMVLFCNQKTTITQSETGYNKTISRGTGAGERVIFTDSRPAHRAKNRWSLPAEIFIGIDETWSAFHQELNKATNGQYAYNPPNTKKKLAK